MSVTKRISETAFEKIAFAGMVILTLIGFFWHGVVINIHAGEALYQAWVMNHSGEFKNIYLTNNPIMLNSLPYYILSIISMVLPHKLAWILINSISFLISSIFILKLTHLFNTQKTGGFALLALLPFAGVFYYVAHLQTIFALPISLLCLYLWLKDWTEHNMTNLIIFSIFYITFPFISFTGFILLAILLFILSICRMFIIMNDKDGGFFAGLGHFSVYILINVVPIVMLSYLYLDSHIRILELKTIATDIIVANQQLQSHFPSFVTPFEHNNTWMQNFLLITAFVLLGIALFIRIIRFELKHYDFLLVVTLALLPLGLLTRISNDIGMVGIFVAWLTFCIWASSHPIPSFLRVPINAVAVFLLMASMGIATLFFENLSRPITSKYAILQKKTVLYTPFNQSMNHKSSIPLTHNAYRPNEIWNILLSNNTKHIFLPQSTYNNVERFLMNSYPLKRIATTNTPEMIVAEKLSDKNYLIPEQANISSYVLKDEDTVLGIQILEKIAE